MRPASHSRFNSFGGVRRIPAKPVHERFAVRSERPFQPQQPRKCASGYDASAAVVHLYDSVASQTVRVDRDPIETLTTHRFHWVAPDLRDLHATGPVAVADCSPPASSTCPRYNAHRSEPGASTRSGSFGLVAHNSSGRRIRP